MSYLFAVTKNIPKMDTEQSFNTLMELSKKESNVFSTDLIMLIGKLKIIYPCITNRKYNEQDADFNWIWADGPLEENINGDIWKFSLVADALNEPLDFIIQEANQLEFSVFSYEFEKIWWADNC